MAEIAVTIEVIESVVPHPNADRLEIAQVLGIQTAVPKGKFQSGQAVVLFPPDMMLPVEVSDRLGVTSYLKSSAFKLSGEDATVYRRVAACRLRGFSSYGFVIDMPQALAAVTNAAADWGKNIVGKDVSDCFGAVKYEPPVKPSACAWGGSTEAQAEEAPNFHRYTHIQHYWKNRKAIPLGEPVRISEKIHGTNSRAGLIKIDGEWRFVGGSHFKSRNRDGGDYEDDKAKMISLYWEPFEVPGVVEMLTELCDEKNEVILYGEIYGRCSGQDLDYAIEDDDFGYRVFDLMINGQYVDGPVLDALCREYNIPMVPLLYKGQFKPELVEELTYGPTTLGIPQNKFKGREGIVITALKEQICCCGRMVVKSVSADYLDRKGAVDNE